jgi:hypothetical protein
MDASLPSLSAACSINDVLASAMSELRDTVRSKLPGWLDSLSPAAFRCMELEVAAVARGFADRVAEAVLHEILSDDAFQAQCCAAAHAGSEKRLRDVGRRPVEVTLLGGRKTTVRVRYLRPDHRGRPGRRRGTGRRGKGGSGLYPALAALGIWFGVTPALADEIARQVTDSDSVRTGRAALERRGIDLGHKQTLRIINAVGRRAVEQRDEWVMKALEGPLPTRGALRGKRVVAAIDGGRVRERIELGGRPSAITGHHRYEGLWKEPKLFCIYVIDRDGNIEDTFRPVYDGTMQNCDGAFARLGGYLKALGVHQAKTLVLLGDGALWIWEAVEALVKTIGIPMKRVTQVVDWYHAVETLEDVAKARSRWPEGERESWMKRAKKALFSGDISRLMGIFDEIAVGRRARAVNKHRDYFVRNAHRMTYASFKAAKIPLGSGCVESAVRRVINMRMKGNGTFWLPENAEAMILLRAYLKAGRFDDLFDWANTTAASWWRPSPGSASAPIKEVA